VYERLLYLYEQETGRPDTGVPSAVTKFER
jgi:rubredoxin